MAGVLSIEPLRRVNVSLLGLATLPRGRDTVGPRLSEWVCLPALPPLASPAGPSNGMPGRLDVSAIAAGTFLLDIGLSREFTFEEGRLESPPPMEENMEPVRSPRSIEPSPLLEVELLAPRGIEPPGGAVLLTARGTEVATLEVGLPILKWEDVELRPLEVGLLMVWAEDL